MKNLVLKHFFIIFLPDIIEINKVIKNIKKTTENIIPNLNERFAKRKRILFFKLVSGVRRVVRPEKTRINALHAREEIKKRGMNRSNHKN